MENAKRDLPKVSPLVSAGLFLQWPADSIDNILTPL